jgi:hypothetical protein
MARKYEVSPLGEAIHPWINKPDTKFNDLGVYKLGHSVGGQEAEDLAERITQRAQEAFDAYVEEKGLTTAEKKKWSVYLPFEREEDDEGNPTGYIVFDYKQNATLKVRETGEEIAVKIAIKDAKDRDLTKPVFGGSLVRVKFSMRPITMTSLKKVGVRLDFAAVQVAKLAQGTGGSSSFGTLKDYEGGEPEGNSEGTDEGDY